MFFPDKSSPLGAGAKQRAIAPEMRDPFLLNYFATVEKAFSQKERESVDAFLEKILFAENGEARDYNDIAHDVFSLERDRSMAKLQEKLEKEGRPRLRDYLLTKADALLGRYQTVDEPAQSGVFPIPMPEEGALAEQYARETETKKRERVSGVDHRPVSRMDLEGLLSKETIGSLDPPTICQANDDFCFPELDGMGFRKEAAAATGTIRSVPTMPESELYADDLVIALPASRIRHGILPVPAGYEVVGSLDQALELVDPHEDNPFCTRMLNAIEGVGVRYVVKPRGMPLRLDSKKFMPDAEEQLSLKQALPFPENELPRVRTSVYAAKLAIAERMRERFLYLCDDRIGRFIERHPNELGTIMDGLRAGHCDLLAWSAAAYFRQLGHTAFVVNTEYTADSGKGFLRDSRHSRVGVIKENGSITYFDPTAVCKAVDGYGLSQIGDEEILEMERVFDGAKDVDEKKAALETFRSLIVERESLIQEKSAEPGRYVRKIEDTDLMMRDIHVTDKDIKSFMFDAGHFFPQTLGDEQKREMNKLCDILAAHGLSLTISDIVRRLQLVEEWSGYSRESLERAFGKADRPAAFFVELCVYEKTAQAFFSERNMNASRNRTTNICRRKRHISTISSIVPSVVFPRRKS